ncbi:DNA helicase UvrD [Acidipropionibacterium jensenii]|nr:DNA helicase UvrD [Acidipropionibacterium jensenii]
MLIMTKQAHQVDGSVKQKAYTFLEKLAKDDAAPGLHIETIKSSVDKRVRTGRVDDKYRAVLFKLAGEHPAYVVYGIWMHDEAIEKARTAKFWMNPVNGIVEIVRAEAAAVPEADAVGEVPKADSGADRGVGAGAGADTHADHVEEAAPARDGVPAAAPGPDVHPATADPLLKVSVAELEGLGIEPGLARRAMRVTDDRAFGQLVESAPTWQSEALLALATGSSLDQVREELELDQAAAGSEANDADMIEALKRPASRMEFAPIDGVDELRRVIEEGDLGAWRVFLHPVQRTWVDKRTNGSFRLAGGAGTGKTVVVVHRARRLARTDPGCRIVLTTFTRNLADELKESLTRLDPGIQLAPGLGGDGVYVNGIDALASAVVRGAGARIATAVEKVLGAARTDVGGRLPRDLWRQVVQETSGLREQLGAAAKPQFLETEYELVVLPNRITTEAEYLRVRRPGRGVRLSRSARQAVWKAVERYREEEALQGCADFAEKAAIAAEYLNEVADREGRPADHVLVDEGQDLKPTHWMLVRALVGEHADDIFIAEDGHQRIYGQKLVLSHYGIATRGRSRKLTLNYRTTAENLRWATAILAGVEYDDLEGDEDGTDGYRSARHGMDPVVRRCSGFIEELDATAETLMRWIKEASGTGRAEAFAVLVRDRNQRDRVVSGLNERGVPAKAVDRGPATGKEPVVMTMHRAKGTEFTRVILFDADLTGADSSASRSYDFSDQDKADAQKRERSLLYVAASRARDELVVNAISGESSTEGRS